MITLLRVEILYQLKVLRRTPDRLLPLATVPLFTAAFLAITQHSHRADLGASAVLGASIIGIWSSALYVAGELIEGERRRGTLEAIIATPAPVSVVLMGRIGTVTAVSFLGLLESGLVAEFGFGLHLTVYHAGLFAAGLAATWGAMVGTSLIMAALFVLTRSIRVYQNSLSYPFYLLSGAMVPIALLPGWLQPLSKLVFLSWAADLLRACLRAGRVPDAGLHLGAILGLGAAGLGVGLWLFAMIMRRVRVAGTIEQV